MVTTATINQATGKTNVLTHLNEFVTQVTAMDSDVDILLTDISMGKTITVTMRWD